MRQAGVAQEKGVGCADKIVFVFAHCGIEDGSDPVHFAVWPGNIAVEGDPHRHFQFSYDLAPSSFRIFMFLAICNWC
jgi:hypothetical protein